MIAKILVKITLAAVILSMTACSSGTKSTEGKKTRSALEQVGPRTNALHGGFNW